MALTHLSCEPKRIIAVTSKQKAKGNGAERELSKFLSATFGGNFMRVPNSGAYVGGKNAFRKASMSENQMSLTKGDIIPPDFMPKLVLESKFYADFPFHSLLTDGKVPQLDKWIEQTIDCVEADDVWFVAFKINRKGWFTCFSADMAPKYTLGNHSVYNDGTKTFVVTDLMKFFTDNKTVVLELTK
jgi:hypothetical protein